MRYIYITLLDIPGDPHFSFDRSVSLPILYLLTKDKQILNVESQEKKHFTIVLLKIT